MAIPGHNGQPACGTADQVFASGKRGPAEGDTSSRQEQPANHIQSSEPAKRGNKGSKGEPEIPGKPESSQSNGFDP